jgi:hypothetical protein
MLPLPCAPRVNLYDALAADQDRRRALPSPLEHALASRARLLAAHDANTLPVGLAGVLAELDGRISRLAASA